ncbi:MAG: aromatic ring-hydroxylating dioxygenase subunit alpha, partial [Actinomycetota bacterium]|nr:aromatic ring-hydroxylating dioxygenase subunit alpha [Actinomycetota bacterium]
MEASLARSAYCDAAVFADEQRLAMATSWVCIGRSDSIGPEPGSYRLAPVAGERVLVVRDSDA